MKKESVYKHIENVTVTAEFSHENGHHYRYWLDIQKNNYPMGKTACVVMQNPSYANEQRADKSVQFMEKVVFEKGLQHFNGVHRLIVVNQFGYIQTNDFKGLSHEIGKGNNSAIEKALTIADIIILAWGSSNPFYERQKFVIDTLNQLTNKTIFKTRMHPSRGRYEGFIMAYP